MISDMKGFRKRLSLGLLVTLMFSAFHLHGRAQDATKEATVYVYLMNVRSGMRRFSGTFFMNDQKIAEISEHRYFVFHPPPGRHALYVKEKNFGGVYLNAEPGKTYYIKIHAIFEAGSTRFRGMTIAPKEEGEFAIEQCEAIRVTDVLDKKLVNMKFTSKD